MRVRACWFVYAYKLFYRQVFKNHHYPVDYIVYSWPAFSWRCCFFLCIALRCYSQLFIPFYSHSSRFDFMKRIFSDFILLYNVFNVRVYHNHKLSHKMLFGGMLSGTISSLLHICPVFICCAPVSTHIHKSS